MQESRADVDLAESVTAKGQPVTARQIRSWREAGVLPPATVRSLGRGRGREVTYPSDAIDVALGMAQALDEDRNLHRAVLIAFARGVGVGDDALSRAYRQTNMTMREGLRSALTKGKVPEIGLASLKRRRGRPPKDAAKYDQMVEAVIAVALGQEHDPKGLRSLLEATFPAAANLSDADLDQAALSMQFIALADYAAKAGRRKLDEARDLLVKLRSSPLLAPMLPALDDDLHLALAVPAMLPPIHVLADTT